MTETELKLLKDAIKAELMLELATSNPINTYNPMNKARQKWLGENQKSKFYGIFGVSKYSSAWDKIRQLTLYIMGESRISKLRPEDEELISEIVEDICQVVYDSRVKMLRSRGLDENYYFNK